MNKALSGMIAVLSVGLAVSAGAQTLTNPVTLPASALHSGAVSARGWVSPQSSSPFYDNTQDQGFFYAPGAGVEVADDIGFTGTYRVDGFQFGYASDPASTSPSADLTVKFYDVDPNTAFPNNVIASFDLTGLPAGGGVINEDLAGSGKEFLWNDSGLGFGWMSLTFSDDAFGWELATGGPSQDAFYQNPPGGFFFFGGNPVASFYTQVDGVAVPEPGAVALFAGVLVSGSGLLALRRRRR